MELETERLRLIPLSRSQLELLLADRGALEQALGLEVSGAALEPELREAVENDMLAGMAAHGAADLWYTEWQIVLKAQRRIIGGLCFKGPPNAEEVVEIGYGLQPPYRGRGYMTEAARAALAWAFSQRGVQAAAAEIERDNWPSQRVARRLGMAPYADQGQFTYWGVERQEFGGQGAARPSPALTCSAAPEVGSSGAGLPGQPHPLPSPSTGNPPRPRCQSGRVP
ncbi:MAG: GNAT family N-acetyltransferase [Chloroflexi bacterium]|nr:GNAT family N-acetyltransferase [Chloroflexota bacterium]